MIGSIPGTYTVRLAHVSMCAAQLATTMFTAWRDLLWVEPWKKSRVQHGMEGILIIAHARMLGRCVAQAVSVLCDKVLGLVQLLSVASHIHVHVHHTRVCAYVGMSGRMLCI